MQLTSFLLIFTLAKPIVSEPLQQLALDTIDYVFRTFFSKLDSEKCDVVNDLGYPIPSGHVTISVQSNKLNMINGIKFLYY